MGNSRLTNVIENNTFFFSNIVFENNWESYITKQKQNIYHFKNIMNLNKPIDDKINEYILSYENSLDTILTILGISTELFERYIFFLLLSPYEKIKEIKNEKLWQSKTKLQKINLWSLEKIQKFCLIDKNFCNFIVKSIIYGGSNDFICNSLPLFEFKKFDITKFDFSEQSLIDTILRYKTKGSYSGQKQNNPEIIIEKVLLQNNIKYSRGKIKNIIRNMDFIIPNKLNPKIIIECSYLVTTSSGMGDKAKTEILVGNQIKSNYPNCLFIGFIDGIGWIIRKNDLERMVGAYDDVFTFKINEINRFEKLLTSLSYLG